MQAKTNREKQVFAKNLRALLASKGISQAEMARFMGVKGSSAFAWTAGNSLPRMDKINKLALWLGVSTDFLLGEKTKPKHTTTPIDDMLREMFKKDPQTLDALTRGSYAEGVLQSDNGKVYNLSDADRETIKNVIKMVLERSEAASG